MNALKNPLLYVASRASIPERPLMWRHMREGGWSINSSWIDEAGPWETKDLSELWCRIEREVHAADGLIPLRRAKRPAPQGCTGRGRPGAGRREARRCRAAEERTGVRHPEVVGVLGAPPVCRRVHQPRGRALLDRERVMKAAFTPGPWSTDSAEHDCLTRTSPSAGKRRICRIWIDDAPLPRLHNAEQAANAKLITAAPDLVSVLLRVRGSCPGRWSATSTPCCRRQAWHDALLQLRPRRPSLVVRRRQRVAPLARSGCAGAARARSASRSATTRRSSSGGARRSGARSRRGSMATMSRCRPGICATAAPGCTRASTISASATCWARTCARQPREYAEMQRAGGVFKGRMTQKGRWHDRPRCALDEALPDWRRRAQCAGRRARHHGRVLRRAGRQQIEIERLRAENDALKRDLQHARDGLTEGRTRMREDNERLRAALALIEAKAHDGLGHFSRVGPHFA